MQMVYQSDSYIVVQFDVPADESVAGAEPRGGFEIVDKHARKEIYIEGALADAFRAGVQDLADKDPTPEAFDEYIARYTELAQHPLVMH